MNLLTHLKSLHQWPEKKYPDCTESYLKCGTTTQIIAVGYNKALTEIESILAGIEMPERLDVNKVEQSIVSHVGKGEEFNEVCNTMDLAKMICSKFCAPKTLSVEEIEEIIKQYTPYGYSVQFGLAQALNKAMEDKP